MRMAKSILMEHMSKRFVGRLKKRRGNKEVQYSVLLQGEVTDMDYYPAQDDLDLHSNFIKRTDGKWSLKRDNGKDGFQLSDLGRLPSLAYNGVHFVALPHLTTLGEFKVYPLDVPFKLVNQDGYIHVFSVVVTHNEDGEPISAKQDQLLLDTKDMDARRFLLKLTILSVGSSYGRYNENDYLSYLVDQEEYGQHKKIKRHATLLYNSMQQRQDFTSPLLKALSNDGHNLSDFYDVMTSKLNYALKDHEDTTQFTEEDKQLEASTVVTTTSKHNELNVSAAWFHDILLVQAKATSHYRDFIDKASPRDTVSLTLLATRGSLAQRNVDYRNLEIDAAVKSLQAGQALQVAKIDTAELTIESERLIEHWGLTTNKIKEVLKQQHKAQIFDVAKYLINTYTSDPNTYLHKELVVDRGYKGFTELLNETYSTQFNEVKIKEALHWWDALRINHKKMNDLPPQQIFTLDSIPALNQLLIRYGAGITDHLNRRLVPILNHPEGVRRARVIYNKLGLALSSWLVEESHLYKSNGGAGIPFGDSEINYLKDLIGVSSRRSIKQALEDFEEYGAIERSEGFIKLGRKNKDQDGTIIEGVKRSMKRSKDGRKRVKNKAGLNKRKQ